MSYVYQWNGYKSIKAFTFPSFCKTCSTDVVTHDLLGALTLSLAIMKPELPKVALTTSRIHITYYASLAHRIIESVRLEKNSKIIKSNP